MCMLSCWAQSSITQGWWWCTGRARVSSAQLRLCPGLKIPQKLWFSVERWYILRVGLLTSPHVYIVSLLFDFSHLKCSCSREIVSIVFVVLFHSSSKSSFISLPLPPFFHVPPSSSIALPSFHLLPLSFILSSIFLTSPLSFPPSPSLTPSMSSLSLHLLHSLSLLHSFHFLPPRSISSTLLPSLTPSISLPLRPSLFLETGAKEGKCKC